MTMKRILAYIIGAAFVWAAWFVWSNRALLSSAPATVYYPAPRTTFWEVQSVDTMKYSRDLAREKAGDQAFDEVIGRQVGEIATMGATHVAVATPYDEEFVPFLKRWVGAARAAGLHVWFRGNFSGWEKWFGSAAMRPDEHVVATHDFILKHADLFEDGDVFSSCPECENGTMGDPRQTGKVAAYRNFLIADRKAAEGAFASIGKSVRTDAFSMNGDVARLVMDDPTTEALGGTVTVDHYVKMPEQAMGDVRAFSHGGKRRVVFGEFGAPIPDIHGKMNEAEQSAWIRRFLSLAAREPAITGMNYWIATGGSTQLWDTDGTPRQAVGVLRAYYDPHLVFGVVRDGLGRPVARARVATGDWKTETDDRGYFELRYPGDIAAPVSVTADGYLPATLAPADSGDPKATRTVTLVPTEVSWRDRAILALRKALGR